MLVLSVFKCWRFAEAENKPSNVEEVWTVWERFRPSRINSNRSNHRHQLAKNLWIHHSSLGAGTGWISGKGTAGHQSLASRGWRDDSSNDSRDVLVRSLSRWKMRQSDAWVAAVYWWVRLLASGHCVWGLTSVTAMERESTTTRSWKETLCQRAKRFEVILWKKLDFHFMLMLSDRISSAGPAGLISAGRFLSAVPILPSLHFPFPSLLSRNADLAVCCFLKPAKAERTINPQLGRQEKRLLALANGCS